ncbi:MAG TPA: asparagine synthase (glutamine-hydrolyzing), partial [Vicinamibacteria bacterium]
TPMCGIAGILNLDGRPVAPCLLERMIDRVRHRGPDGRGTHVDQQVGLAHVRLSIIDPASGAQPMHNEDGSVSITFNGEIFNYVELRAELRRRGHRFRTECDTEVLLRLYEEQGEECVRQLNGQWAFAIWDRRKQKLFLSRDRLGVRPLFYAVGQRELSFGSEMKSILALPHVSREIDPLALDQVFTFWVSLPPRTTFKAIRELPPGHSLTVQHGRISVARHWQLDYPAEGDKERASEDEYAGELLKRLVDATRIRLRSDVPVGAYLSGGLDSTLVTALTRRFTGVPLKTFSVGFDDPEFDETRHQREAVRFLGTRHEEVRCTLADIGRVFPNVVWHAERPILRTAPAPLYILSELVRARGYKVVLTGEGSDEMFGGYDIFKEAKVRRFCAALPESRRRLLLLRRLYPYLGKLQSQSDAYLQAFFGTRGQDTGDPFFSHLPRWRLTAKLKALFSDAVRSELGAYDGLAELEGTLPKGYAGWDGLTQAQYLEAAHLLPGYILSSQGDRMAMAHSVEGRFPFLDHRVVEFAARIPARLKLKVLDEKYLLKRCALGLVPPSVTQRAKQPYRAPEGACFFGAAGLEYVEELLSPGRIAQDGIFNPATVEKLVAKFKGGRAAGMLDNMALVGVLSTQLVVDQFVRGRREELVHAERGAGSAALCH